MKSYFFLLILCIAIMALVSNRYEEKPANDLFSSLTEDQRDKACYKLTAEDRFRWHYLPATSFARPGIALLDLNSKQQELVFQLLKDNLSEAGYDKMKRIMDLENVLAELEKNPERRDPQKYHIAFYGDPGEAVWAWSFQGHHVSLHFTVNDDKIAFVPRFLGSNPAMIKEGPRKGERTLKREEDLGFELINSLSDKQKAKAILPDHDFGDIETTNAPDVDPLDPAGIKIEALTEAQKGTLQTLIKEYLAVMPDDLAAQRLEKLRHEEMNEITFAWAGSMKLGAAHYYRVQGKTFLIEFDNSQNNANHIHSVWRDFDGDFGRDLIKEHYQNADHH